MVQKACFLAAQVICAVEANSDVKCFWCKGFVVQNVVGKSFLRKNPLVQTVSIKCFWLGLATCVAVSRRIGVARGK